MEFEKILLIKRLLMQQQLMFWGIPKCISEGVHLKMIRQMANMMKAICKQSIVETVYFI